jgi:hypothetical protein
MDYNQLIRTLNEIAARGAQPPQAPPGVQVPHMSNPDIPMPHSFDTAPRLPRVEDIGPYRGSMSMPLGPGTMTLGGGAPPGQSLLQGGISAGWRQPF